MLIIAASPDVNIQKFIELLSESTCEFTVQNFQSWQQSTAPKGFVYIKVLPEIAFNRLKKTNTNISFDEIKTDFEHLNNYFITKTTMPEHLHTIPVLVLNGFVDFEADISQFYNHLFYIKKFFQEILDQESKKKGTYVAPKKHSCGRC